MTDTTNTCPCGQPAADSTICPACTERLSRALGDIPAIADELQTVLTRQTKAGGGVGYVTSSPTRPLPYDDKASEVRIALHGVLVSWTRLVLDESATAPLMPRDDLASLGMWLLGQVGWLRLHGAAGDAVDEITHAVEGVRRVAYREVVPRTFAGICSEPTDTGPCPADLYARENATTVTCQVCATPHSMHDRRMILMQAVEDQLVTGPELTTAVSTIARPISGSTIRSWVARRQLVAHGENAEGRALYRVGDVLDLLARGRKSA